MSSMDLKTRLRSWRCARGLTVPQLAEKVGVTRAAVYQWEGTGKSAVSPTYDHLLKVVDVFGITIQRFFGPLPGEAKRSRA